MVLRLSELLERIRPAGAPGASTEGEQQHQQAEINRQTADIATVLARFDAEMDDILTAAHEKAERLRRSGEQRAHHITAGLPDRLAVARSAASRQRDERGVEDSARIAEESTNEIARLRANAAIRTPRLVGSAMNSIWSAVESGPKVGSRP
ncbi:MAG: hypothetical protein DRJ50_07385 [Actinobacteria bacterium]|nr:MAG: hypothetical protein DRJ50_07385 [Actinomycetota bacterium]